MAIAGVLTGLTILWHVALIFVAHAAFDRRVGYGLKYAAGFTHTQLGSVGNLPRAVARFTQQGDA